MYNMTIHVREYVGCIGVSAFLWDKDDLGESHFVADTPELFYADADMTGDPLEDCFRSVRKWAHVQSNYARVDDGVSPDKASS